MFPETNFLWLAGSTFVFGSTIKRTLVYALFPTTAGIRDGHIEFLAHRVEGRTTGGSFRNIHVLLGPNRASYVAAVRATPPREELRHQRSHQG